MVGGKSHPEAVAVIAIDLHTVLDGASWLHAFTPLAADDLPVRYRWLIAEVPKQQTAPVIC